MTSSFVANRNELAAAFKTLNRRFWRARRDLEAVLTFDNERLSIDANGIIVRASGIGSLQGQAYVYGPALLDLADTMPEGDSVLIKVVTGRLIIGTERIPCIWQESLIRVIEHPMDAPPLRTLRLKDKYTDEEMVRSGLIDKVWEAERKMEEMIRQAAAILRPLDVDAADVRKLVMDSVYARDDD